ncbi:MAG TPA: apolipoprotein N-acyltransferase [Sumerlaeia bacterium]|nr:apolipoprotein N-acyltransferase [Sumerlaeia bacterium]
MAKRRLLLRPFPTRSEWRELRRPLLSSAASAALLRLAYPPVEWGWLAYVGMAPFLFFLRGRTAKQGAWLGLGFGFPFFYLNLTWLNTLSDVNPLAPLGILCLALICAVAPVLFGALAAAALARGGSLRFLLIPALWTAIEYVRSLTELGFPWIYLGHTQVNCLPLIQICDLTGVYGLSFVIVLANVVVADTCRLAVKREGRAPWLALKWAVLVAAFVFLAFYSSLRSRSLQDAGPGAGSPGPSLRVVLVQPGVPQSRKLASYADPDLAVQERIQSEMVRDLEKQILQIHAECEASGDPAPDLYVLPESAITHPAFNLVSELREKVQDWARQVGAPIFFGANRFEPPYGIPSDDPRFSEWAEIFNSAYLVDGKDGLKARPYDKMHLVPFGEFSSYFDAIPGFTSYILGIGEFAPGRVARPFFVADTRFGCVICFESCFPYLFRKYARQGVDWMTVITNDAWYKRSTGARRHQTQAVFRAVEMRRPIVRVANTGISCIIDAQGRTTALLELREGAPAHAIASLPLPPASASRRTTIYMRPWGEWFSWLCIAYCGFVFWRLRERRHAKPK